MPLTYTLKYILLCYRLGTTTLSVVIEKCVTQYDATQHNDTIHKRIAVVLTIAIKA